MRKDIYYNMDIKIIDGIFNVSKVSSLNNINLNEEFVFVSKTDKEISVVYRSDYNIENVLITEKNWKLFRIDANLDFSLIGIISKLANILKENDIPIFVISTFDTDYFLVKEIYFKKTVELLKDNNYDVR